MDSFTDIIIQYINAHSEDVVVPVNEEDGSGGNNGTYCVVA